MPVGSFAAAAPRRPCERRLCVSARRRATARRATAGCIHDRLGRFRRAWASKRWRGTAAEGAGAWPRCPVTAVPPGAHIGGDVCVGTQPDSRRDGSGVVGVEATGETRCSDGICVVPGARIGADVCVGTRPDSRRAAVALQASKATATPGCRGGRCVPRCPVTAVPRSARIGADVRARTQPDSSRSHRQWRSGRRGAAAEAEFASRQARVSARPCAWELSPNQDGAAAALQASQGRRGAAAATR